MQQEAARRRLIAVMVGCIGLAGAVLGRAVFIQVISDSRLESMAKRQFQSKVLVRPRRGAIVDRNGEALAVNFETQSLAADPLKIPNQGSRVRLARLLARATGMPYSKLLARLGEKREFVWIKRHLSPAELARFKKFRIIDQEGDLARGFFLVRESERAYPHGDLASHVLGDVNIDSEGVEGTELWMNQRLRGKVVSVSAVKDALGRPTFIDAEAVNQVKDGENVALTLDASLQFSVEEALRNSVRKFSARSGTAIVMNAVTGEILAMANEPSFNPNDAGAPASHRRNRALTDGYEPGSIMKPVLLAGVLSHGGKLTDQVYAEKGSFYVQGRKIAEAETHERFEWISLKKVIQVSSNVGAAKIALKYGADRYIATLRSFGFGAKSGTGFPGEISGRIPPRKAWQPLTLANIGFGQGILVTPIQMLRAYAAFLNGGWLVQPRLLKDLPEGAKPEPPKRIVSQKVADEVVEALEGVTEKGGTGLTACLDGYRVAGKTGTAQEVDPDTHRYSRSRYVASFVGFAVATEPKLVIFTSITEPHGAYYAADTAAPLFHDVLQAAANRFSLPETQPIPDSARQKLAVSGSRKKDRLVSSAAHPILVAPVPSTIQWQGAGPGGVTLWKMPKLRGLTAREAMRILRGHKFDLQLNGDGVIRAQAPDDGKTIADGARIRLTLSEP